MPSATFRSVSGDPAQRDPLFPSRRAFIVQFTRDASSDTPPQCSGRVEHVVSGRSLRFEKPEELWSFMREVMADIPMPEGADNIARTQSAPSKG
ncbi:MAG TPA: hypothetical protein VEB21_07065 [Terriglobales bacterium]|nr:hypothetical protein [Terriglobales bacterium]